MQRKDKEDCVLVEQPTKENLATSDNNDDSSGDTAMNSDNTKQSQPTKESPNTENTEATNGIEIVKKRKIEQPPIEQPPVVEKKMKFEPQKQTVLDYLCDTAEKYNQQAILRISSVGKSNNPFPRGGLALGWMKSVYDYCMRAKSSENLVHKQPVCDLIRHMNESQQDDLYNNFLPILSQISLDDYLVKTDEIKKNLIPELKKFIETKLPLQWEVVGENVM